MTEHQRIDNDVATLLLFRPEITHFDDEWGPAQRVDTLTDIFAGAAPSRSTRMQPNGRRWRALSAVAACAAAAAVAVGLLLPAGAPGGPDAAAAATLNKLSIVAGSTGRSVGADQFAYVREDTAQTMSVGEAQTPVPYGESRMGDLSLSTGEQWTSPKGTVWRKVPLEGGRSCLAKDLHVANKGRNSDYVNFSASELAQLPTGTDQLANYIDTHPNVDGHRNVNRFAVVADLLRSGLAPPALRAAALRVLAQTTGLTVAADSHDSAGRSAIRVDHSFGYGTESLFFDASTSRVLEEQTTQDHYLFRALVRQSTVVDSIPNTVPLCH